MKPVVDGLASRYSGTYDIRIKGTSSDPAAEALAQKYNIPGVPTFVFLNRDGSLADTIIGAVPESQLVAALETLKQSAVREGRLRLLRRQVPRPALERVRPGLPGADADDLFDR
jgi:thioredoxin-related protein